MKGWRLPDPVPPRTQLALFVLACAGLTLFADGVMIDTGAFASVQDVLWDTTVAALSATAAVLALRVGKPG